jgi:cob(I)alamin adenosyltransferase
MTGDGQANGSSLEPTARQERGRGLGMVHVYTGDGKGKTSAALGMAFRAAGWGLRTLFIQFIKGGFRYGELNSAAASNGLIEIRPLGKGFIKDCNSAADSREDRVAAEEALKVARDCLAAGAYQIVVLDEVLYAVRFKLLSAAAVAEVVAGRAKGVEVVVTGGGPVPPEIDALADYVTEMKARKHPFGKGVKARKGVEF